MLLGCRRGHVEHAVRALAVRIAERFTSYIRYRKVGKKEGIADETKGHHRKRIQVGPAFEENQLETELSARAGSCVARVIPPFRLGFGVGREIARQRHRIVFAAVPEGIGLTDQSVGHRIENDLCNFPRVAE